MLKNRKIALYIDVDNCSLDYEHYQNCIIQAQDIGEIVRGKMYGVSEVKNKQIYADIIKRGYDIAPTMRIKKRGQKIFDNRIIVDVLEDVLQNANIDAVAIVCAPSDFVYFFSRLRSYNLQIIALDNNDEESSAFVNEFLDIGIVEKLKPVEKKSAKPTKTTVKKTNKVEKPAVVEPVQQDTIPKEVNLAETKQEIVEIKEEVKPTTEEKAVDQVSKTIEQVNSLSNNATPVNDDDAELLDEIKKLLDEFKTN